MINTDTPREIAAEIVLATMTLLTASGSELVLRMPADKERKSVMPCTIVPDLT
jgi:hypothetical protein